jgi:hypothetical protein
METRKRTSLESQASGPRTFGPDSNDTKKFSTVPNPSSTPAASQADSVPQGTARREPGPAQKARRKAGIQRDGRSNLGVGKDSTVVTE